MIFAVSNYNIFPVYNILTYVFGYLGNDDKNSTVEDYPIGIQFFDLGYYSKRSLVNLGD